MIDEKVIPAQLLNCMEIQEAAYWKEYYGSASPEQQSRLGIWLNHIGGSVVGALSSEDILAFNRVLGIGINQRASESDILNIINFYQIASIPRFFVQVSPYCNPYWLPEILKDYGFEHYNNWAKLYRPIYPLPLAETDLRIKQIGPEEADAFADIITGSFGWPVHLAEIVRLPIGRSGWKHYIAYDGDRPAACAALFINGAYASLSFAATLPDYRGRGAQSALIAKRFYDAAAQGCEWMFSETAENLPERPVQSYRNMIRHGFEPAYLRPSYLYQF